METDFINYCYHHRIFFYLCVIERQLSKSSYAVENRLNCIPMFGSSAEESKTNAIV